MLHIKNPLHQINYICKYYEINTFTQSLCAISYIQKKIIYAQTTKVYVKGLCDV